MLYEAAQIIANSKMIFPVAATILLLGCSGIFAEEDGFSYDAQNLWPGFCVSNNTGRQSPINVVSGDVAVNEDLIELELSGYGDAIGGTFINTGITQEFDPSDEEAIRTLRNHLGTYELVNVHIHWSNANGAGSEHQFDGSQYDAEIHFVHRQLAVSSAEGPGSEDVDATAGDFISVLAVFANAVNDNISGIWEQLPVQPGVDASIDVPEILLTDLLPQNRNYYQYSGSLTTPNCNEIVQWFLFTTPIDIPQDYLDALRTVDGTTDVPLDTNIRDAQDLNSRMVYSMESGGTILTVSIWLLLLGGLMTFLWV